MSASQCKHTPGPWQIENLTKAAEQSWFNVLDSRGFAVAEAVGDRATARLIAAAPDMLVMLKAFDAGFRDYQKLKVVIAKAEGRSESAKEDQP